MPNRKWHPELAVSHQDAVFHARICLPGLELGRHRRYVREPMGAPDCSAYGSTTETDAEIFVTRVCTGFEEALIAGANGVGRRVWSSRRAATTTTIGARMERELPEFRKRHSRAGTIPGAAPMLLQQVRAGKVRTHFLRDGGEAGERTLPSDCTQRPC
jgi:hypothetical protein